MKKFFVLFLFTSASLLLAQTTLISPTGAGGFELGSTFTANGWTEVNSTANTWHVGSAATPYAGSNSAYVSSDAGTTWSYDNAAYHTSHFYRDVTVPAGETDIQLSFQWKGAGESGWDRFLIFTAPTSVTPVADIPASNSTTISGATLAYSQSVFPQAAYTSLTVYLPAALAGTTFRLIFTWQNDDLFGDNPPVTFDNISLVSQNLSLFSLPYNQSFDDLAFPPPQWALTDVSGAGDWYRTTSTTYNSTPGAMRYNYNTTTAADAWAFTPGFLLTSGNKYRVKFWQRVGSGYPENLKVTVGTAATVAAQTTTLWDVSPLTNVDWIERNVDFNCTATDTFFFAFNCYSLADQWFVAIDELNIDLAPTNDIGIASIGDNVVKENMIVNSGVSRELFAKEERKDFSIPSYPISIKASTGNSSIESNGVFDVVVENFAAVTENSYAVGWKVNGTAQSNVSNTDPLEAADTDTLTLTWGAATPGLHTLKAWTVLATDTNPNNDSSQTLNFEIPPANTIFREAFEGTIPPAGWDTVNVDGGGTSPCWFSGNPSVFPALELNKYAGSNYQGANGFYIDNWLITPNTGGLEKNTEAVRDSLVFYMRSIKSNPYDDTVEVRLSTTTSAVSSFTTLLARFLADTSGNWKRYAFALPNSANRYIAFRYVVYDGGPTGTYSNYIGLDLVEIQRYTSKTVNLTALIEGFYEGSTMVPDSVKVELHSASAPFGKVDEAFTLLNSSGVGAAEFFSAPAEATNYYIVVKHRNSIETWSKSPGQSFSGGVINYDFTTAASQAYGDNLKLKSGKYCIFSGDVPLQDGLVDLTDEISVINDANSFASGPGLGTDLNGDESTDLSDIIIVVNNANAFISKQTPETLNLSLLKNKRVVQQKD
jgi:hypothetical protein